MNKARLNLGVFSPLSSIFRKLRPCLARMAVAKRATLPTFARRATLVIRAILATRAPLATRAA